MTLIMTLQNLQQENGTLLMTKTMDDMAEDMKMIQTLNLKQKVIKPNHCDYSEAYILVTGDIKVADVAANTNNGDNKVERDRHRKYFLPRVDITNYNVLIDGRSFYDQSINDQIKKYDEIRKIATGKGDDYTTGCLLDYQYFKDHYQLIAFDLSKQKELDADLRAIQQIGFYGMLNTNSQVFTVLEKSKETILEFYKGTAKVL